MAKPLQQLALIIPAYRGRFLAECLASIAAQTNRHFQLYVFDDHSPEDLATVVRGFQEGLSIHYHRFPENMGQEDLAGHWNRCIRLTRGEEYVWIISDDDTISPDCVASFYEYLERNAPEPGFLFRFHMNVVDEKGAKVYEPPSWPPHITAAAFLQGRIDFSLMSSVNEYIFSRKAFEFHPFPSFPLAWCSDDAAWMQYALPKGILSLPTGKVCWRSSETNISSNHSSAIGRQKMQACTLFLKWLEHKAEENPSLRLTLGQKANWLAGHSRMLSGNALWPAPCYALLPVFKNLGIPLFFKYLFALLRAWPRHLREKLRR